MSKGAKIAIAIVVVVAVLFGITAFTGGSSEGIYQANLNETVVIPHEGNGDLDVMDEYSYTITTDENGMLSDVDIDVFQLSKGIEEGKKELGFEYGMADVSEIGLEWFEQAELLEKAVVDNQGVTELVDAMVDVDGKMKITDVVTDVTVDVSGYLNDLQVILSNYLA